MPRNYPTIHPTIRREKKAADKTKTIYCIQMHIPYTIYGICGCKMGKPIEPPVFKKSYYYVIWD